MDNLKMDNLKKAASDYSKLMMKNLKEWYGEDKKSPMQLSKEEKKEFFKKMDKAWKSKKESSTLEEKVAAIVKKKLN